MRPLHVHELDGERVPRTQLRPPAGVGHPAVVVVVDELAALTAYCSLRRRTVAPRVPGL
jgi:hypothetical protein